MIYKNKIMSYQSSVTHRTRQRKPIEEFLRRNPGDEATKVKGHARVPAQVALVQVDDAGARHGGRGGRAQVADLEQEAHLRRQRNALVAGQRQDLEGGARAKEWRENIC